MSEDTNTALLRRERDRGHNALYRIAHALGWSGPQPSPLATDELIANLVAQVVAALRERDELREQYAAYCREQREAKRGDGGVG